MQTTPIADASIGRNSGWLLTRTEFMVKISASFPRLKDALSTRTCLGAFLWLLQLSHPHSIQTAAWRITRLRGCHCPPSCPHRSQGACSKLRHRTLIAREINALGPCNDIDTAPFLLLYFYPAPSHSSSSPPETAAPRCLNKRWTCSSSPTTAPITLSMCPACHLPSSTPSTMSLTS